MKTTLEIVKGFRYANHDFDFYSGRPGKGEPGMVMMEVIIEHPTQWKLYHLLRAAVPNIDTCGVPLPDSPDYLCIEYFSFN